MPKVNIVRQRKWRRRYEVYGYEGLEIQIHNRSYSAELKLQAVKDYLYGGLSQYQVRGIYGYRRLTLHLRRQTEQRINHKRIQRLMKLKGIQSVIRRKKKKYARSTPQQVTENLLNREFHAKTRYEKWVTDVMF